jgi:replicative superfamily II helicase
VSTRSGFLLEQLGAGQVALSAAQETLIRGVGARQVNPGRARGDLQQFAMALEGHAASAYEMAVSRPADLELRRESDGLFSEAADCLRRLAELSDENEESSEFTSLEYVLPSGLDLPFRLAVASLCARQVADARLQLDDLVSVPGVEGTACSAAVGLTSRLAIVEHARPWSWRERLLADTFGSFILLVRKSRGWQDLDDAMSAMGRLRERQGEEEEEYLTGAGVAGRAVPAATELAGIFHMAQMATLVGDYLQSGTTDASSLMVRLDRHSDEARYAFRLAADLFLRPLTADGRTDITPHGYIDPEIPSVEGGWSHLKDSDEDDDETANEEWDPSEEAQQLAVESLRLERLARLLWAGCRELIRNSIWYQAEGLGDKASEFVRSLTSRASARPILELWPSQQEALSKNLLDQYRKAVLVQMPTSSGKTLLAQFVLLQNLSLRRDTTAVYVVPTRALVNQITRNLRADFRLLGLTVEQAAPSFDIDPLENAMLAVGVDILVTTPEKLSLLLRRDHPILSNLSLVIVDEAHNLADGERGAKLELLLATFRRDRPNVRYLLMSPFLPSSEQLVEWLGDERGLTPIHVDWRPGRRVVALAKIDGRKPHLKLALQTLPAVGNSDLASGIVIPLDDLDVRLTSVRALSSRTAKALRHRRGSTLVLCYGPARAMQVAAELAEDEPRVERSEMVERAVGYLDAELGAPSALSDLLRRGVAYHHSGMSPEARLLVEELVREGVVHSICGTTTLAQGVNFPISNVLIEDDRKGQESHLSYSDFWNVAGRAGRTLVDDVGLVVFPVIKKAQETKWREYLKGEAVEIASQLTHLVDRADELVGGFTLQDLRQNPGLSDLMQFLAHALRASGDAETASTLEDLLRNSLVFRQAQREDPARARALIRLCRDYITRVSGQSRSVALSDATGFSTTSINRVSALSSDQPGLDDRAEWQPASLFSGDISGLTKRMRILGEVPELGLGWEQGGTFDPARAAGIISDWVNGFSLKSIADRRFAHVTDQEKRVLSLSRYLLGQLAFKASWGLGALEVASLPATDHRGDEAYVPSMVFFGVQSREAVWMRLADVPRIAAESLGSRWKREVGGPPGSKAELRAWLTSLPAEDWQGDLNAPNMKNLWSEVFA